MDFSLLESNPDFNLNQFFGSIKDEFKLAGKEVVIERKQKKINHFYERASQSGYLSEFSTVESLKDLLRSKIHNTNMDRVKADTQPFIRNPEEVEIYSADYFMQLVDMMQWKTA